MLQVSESVVLICDFCTQLRLSSASLEGGELKFLSPYYPREKKTQAWIAVCVINDGLLSPEVGLCPAYLHYKRAVSVMGFPRLRERASY